MVPKTADGRVLFAIPWHGATMVGTTDEPVNSIPVEPRSHGVGTHSSCSITSPATSTASRSRRRSSACGPGCVRWCASGGKTSQLSRDHTILVAPSGLITVVGGKWTTYRRMGQDTIDRAMQVASLPARKSATLEMKLHGWTEDISMAANSEWERVYGSDLPALHALSAQDPSLDALLHPRLPYRKREVIWAARYEMARTVEDVLARRTRALFLDARAAIEAAPAVACLLAKELRKNESWRDHQVTAFTRARQRLSFRSMMREQVP